MTIDTLRDLLVQIHDYQAIAELLSWDQQTLMPIKGDEARARQSALAATQAHKLLVSDRLADLLEAAGNDESLSDDERIVVERATRDRQRAIKVPTDLVERLVSVTSRAHHIWAQARQDDDFHAFAPILDEILSLKREQAQALGWPEDGEPYDALLDEYEPDTTSRLLEPIVERVAQESSAALKAILGSGTKPDRSILTHRFPEKLQEKFCRHLLQSMGFDFRAGRLDRSAHPFTTSFDPGDVRLTTRYDETYWPMAVFGSIHEGGHGLYEQGLDSSWVGTALSEAVSLGIHESQSRLWENQIGRSRAFWQYFFPEIQSILGAPLAGGDMDAFYLAVNSVRPSLIRVEADEVTYNLHIALRFKLERALLQDDLLVRDLPAAWNQASEELLGVRPKNHAEGLLQDVHWSMGLLGYFPTYLLGNLYAAQLTEAVRRDISDLDDQVAQGRFSDLLSWLRHNVHRHGRRFSPPELIERATGKPPSADPFVRYLKNKYGPLYGVTW